MTGPAADGALLIHGAHHGAWAWDDLAPLLELSYLAVSLPGRDGAASSRQSLGSLTLDDLITSATADLEGTGWDRAVIVGHSLGGAVAAGLAARVPQRAHHLVLPGETAYTSRVARPPPQRASAPPSSRSTAGTTRCCRSPLP